MNLHLAVTFQLLLYLFLCKYFAAAPNKEEEKCKEKLFEEASW